MATINEDFVSFETAKLLKEKGFDEICWRYWSVPENEIYGTDGIPFQNHELVDAFTASTLQMAMKWLTEQYKFYVHIAPSVEGYYWTEKWHSYVDDLNKRYPFGRFVGTFNSPEEACEAAIKYCLENLI